MHAAEPVVGLYEPGAHASHDPPFDPVKPGLHSQSLCAPLPSGDTEFAAHARQLLAGAKAKLVLYARM